ncbi:hypothetical protein F4825DRAFT_431068 [Nemania diffusa]|nr:hypothetical protein F4825DRAFT_431068 [Nemania diffusa]
MDKEVLRKALASHQRLIEIVRRDMLEPEAIRGNDNTLWQTMESSFCVLSRRYIAASPPIELFEAEIRDIWCMFTLAAQNIEAHHPAQDRLLRIILGARQRGVLQRMMKQETTIPIAEEDVAQLNVESQTADTSQGRIWVDLPFLVQDVRSAWKKLMEPSASFAQCCNLTAAIARLAASGVCDNSFSQCGLEIMKQALETQPTSSSSVSNTRAERLALVEIWLSYAKEDLLRLCLATSTYTDPSWALDEQQLVGPLAQEAGINPATACSKERFAFWKDRLVVMKAEAEDNTSLEARCAHMITMVWDDHYGILPFYRV